MKRKFTETLKKWKSNQNKKPLLVYGARQVGKTYIIKEFGENEYDNYIHVNFQTNKMVKDIFKNDITPEHIIKELEIFYNIQIDENKTLIFFDEIQECSQALTSLKYFCESDFNYNIIAAGSLLGVYVGRESMSFPVGKVEIANLYPMDFEEFLIATNNELLANEIKSSFISNKKLSETMHEKALSLYYDYLIVGGMPEVVKEYIKSNSLISASDIESMIISSYKSDVTNYAKESEKAKILSTYDSIPIQLAKENKKFQYKLIQKGGTSSIFGYAIDWLVNSGIVIKCTKTNIGVPLKMYEELESFKLYLSDTGLLVNMSNFPLYLIKNNISGNELMMGMITENYVATSLKSNDMNINYWKNDYSSEVDFILQSRDGKIIPLEVKSSNNTKSRSLTNYIEEFKPAYAIRVSTKNFGFSNNIKSVPLYAVFCINSISLDEIAK